MCEPKKYPSIRIEDLCSKVTSGGTPSRKKPEFYTGEIPWIKTGELKGWFIYDAVEKITQEAIQSSSAKIYPKNTILMAMYGDGRTIGSTAITAIEAASNQACCAMTVDPDKCIPLFLFYSLQHYRKTIVNLALGGAQRNLNQGTIKNFEINCPPLIQQSKIVDVLSKYDNLIENNNRRIAILEEMTQSLYREWFVNFRYPGHADTTKNSESADENSDETKDKNSNKPTLIDSPLGPIPEGWEVKRIKDIGTVNTGKTPSKKKSEYYSSEDVPFLKTPDMHGAIFSVDITDYLSEVGANSQKNKYVPANSICVSCIGARAGVVTITSEKLQTNQQINSVVLNNEIFREYFYLFAVSLHQKIHALGSSGATMTNVNKSKFEGIELIVPPTSIIQAFNLATGSSFDLILNLQKRNRNLKKQRDMLLPKLISGQIELKE